MNLVPENINESIKHLTPRSTDEIINQVKDLDTYNKIQFILKMERDYPNMFQDFKENKDLDDESNQLLFLMKIKNAMKNKSDDVDKLVSQLAKKYGRNNILEKAKDLFKDSEIAQLKLSIYHKTQTKEEKFREKYYNTYAFIGYTEDKEVIIKGKKYYEKELGIENLVKIDKYNHASLSQISMMKMRAPIQYGGDSLGKVWCVYIPKDWLNEDHYQKRDIPDFIFKYIDENKFRV
jgi:hypothetical protein